MSRKLWKCATPFIILVFFVGILIWLTFLGILYMFGNVGIEVIAIQLRMPLTGVDSRYYVNFFLLLLFVVLLSVLFGIYLWKSFSQERLFCVKASLARGILTGAAFFLLGSSLVTLDMKYELYDFLFRDQNYYTYFEDNYYMPRVDEIVAKGEVNNLVLLILESVEDTVNDPVLFDPILMPRMLEMKKKGISFSRRFDVVGTAVSIQSFYSSMMGVPVGWVDYKQILGKGLNIKGEAVRDPIDFDPARGPVFHDLSLVGILEQKGYDIIFFCAADSAFSSYDKFFGVATKHTDIRDFPYFVSKYGDKLKDEEKNSWGVNDSFLLRQVKEYLTERVDERPFVVIIQTVNTHEPGYYEKNLPRPYGDYRDACVQVDIMASDFVKWIFEQPMGKNTTLAFYGDHCFGFEHFGSVAVPSKSKRKIMTALLNSRHGEQGTEIDKLCAMWDFTPTFLEAIGFTVPGRRFGLGTSLFSSEQTLLQKDGMERYNYLFKKRSKLYEDTYAIW